MNAQAFLKSVFGLAVLLGAFWLWWHSTAPDFPASPASVQRPSQPVAVSVIVPKFLPQKEPVANAIDPSSPSLANANNSSTLVTTEPSEDNDRTTRAKAALAKTLARIANPKGATDVAYALAHQDPSLPDSAYLTLPLNQAEHHIFDIGGKSEASIEGYYYDDVRGPGFTQGTGTVEWVKMYTWQRTSPSGAIGPEGPSETIRPITAFSPEDQDYIRNWAKQQAAAAAASAASTPTPSAPEPPALYVPPQPSAPTIITN